MKNKVAKKNKAALLAGMLCMAGAAPALAQSSVQVYGIIDTAIERLSNAGPNGESLTRMPNLSGGMFPSRIGLRGSEDLGNGLKAIFTLENGFGPDAGGVNQGGRLFGRQAWVGLSGDWGAVTVGRNYSMLFFSRFDTDIIGPSQYSMGSLDLYLPNDRKDNSIAYKGTFSGVTVGATYSLGRDAATAGGPSATGCGGESATDDKACRAWSAMLRYDSKRWGAALAYDTYNGGPGAAAAFSPTSSALSDTRINLGAYVVLGDWKVSGGRFWRDNEGNALTPRSTLSYLGAAYAVTPMITIDGQVLRLDFRDSGNDTNMVVLRGMYNFSKRTTVYLMGGKVDNSGAAAVALSAGATTRAGGTQNGVMAGIKHAF
ncbi:putative porin [Massilia sp. UYP11]|uniref:porin n=1 Tax=Massilia sp. UYP11 TaxID=1756385 RepID=UPI003D1AFB86